MRAFLNNEMSSHIRLVSRLIILCFLNLPVVDEDSAMTSTLVKVIVGGFGSLLLLVIVGASVILCRYDFHQ